MFPYYDLTGAYNHHTRVVVQIIYISTCTSLIITQCASHLFLEGSIWKQIVGIVGSLFVFFTSTPLKTTDAGLRVSKQLAPTRLTWMKSDICIVPLYCFVWTEVLFKFIISSKRSFHKALTWLHYLFWKVSASHGWVFAFSPYLLFQYFSGLASRQTELNITGSMQSAPSSFCSVSYHFIRADTQESRYSLGEGLWRKSIFVLILKMLLRLCNLAAFTVLKKLCLAHDGKNLTSTVQEIQIHPACCFIYPASASSCSAILILILSVHTALMQPDNHDACSHLTIKADPFMGTIRQTRLFLHQRGGEVESLPNWMSQLKLNQCGEITLILLSYKNKPEKCRPLLAFLLKSNVQNNGTIIKCQKNSRIEAFQAVNSI